MAYFDRLPRVQPLHPLAHTHTHRELLNGYLTPPITPGHSEPATPLLTPRDTDVVEMPHGMGTLLDTAAQMAAKQAQVTQYQVPTTLGPILTPSGQHLTAHLTANTVTCALVDAVDLHTIERKKIHFEPSSCSYEERIARAASLLPVSTGVSHKIAVTAVDGVDINSDLLANELSKQNVHVAYHDVRILPQTMATAASISCQLPSEMTVYLSPSHVTVQSTSNLLSSKLTASDLASTPDYITHIIKQYNRLHPLSNVTKPRLEPLHPSTLSEMLRLEICNQTDQGDILQNHPELSESLNTVNGLHEAYFDAIVKLGDNANMSLVEQGSEIARLFDLPERDDYGNPTIWIEDVPKIKRIAAQLLKESTTRYVDAVTECVESIMQQMNRMNQKGAYSTDLSVSSGPTFQEVRVIICDVEDCAISTSWWSMISHSFEMAGIDAIMASSFGGRKRVQVDAAACIAASL